MLRTTAACALQAGKARSFYCAAEYEEEAHKATSGSSSHIRTASPSARAVKVSGDPATLTTMWMADRLTGNARRDAESNAHPRACPALGTTRQISAVQVSLPNRQRSEIGKHVPSRAHCDAIAKIRIGHVGPDRIHVTRVTVSQ